MSGKVKESNLVISSEKEGRWLERANECLTEEYNRLSGKLLTTLEVALPTGRQLEALKARVKDIQGETWDILHDRKYQQFANWFSVLGPDESTDTKPSEEQFKAEVKKFQDDLVQMVIEELDWFKKITVNLVILAIEDREKKEALKSEAERLIGDASYKLRRRLKRGIKDVLLEVL